ncbi:MAG: protoporphyrinogen oxidase [Planctomycetota bacterium]
MDRTADTAANTSAAAGKSVAIIGAGITGLAAAVRLHDTLPHARLTVFESSGRPGGVLHTVRRDGFLVERSADNFLTKQPWAADFCRRIGISDQLLPTDAKRRKALVLKGGKIAPAPEGFVLMAPKRLGPILRSPLLSWRGKLRLCCEPLVPSRRAAGDESVASFARRRLGDEVFARLVQPLLAGIYTADPTRLSMAATMPQFVEQEQRHGSLAWAAWRERAESPPPSENAEPHRDEQNASGARYGLFLAPRGGMQQMIDAAAAALPRGCIQTGRRVTSIAPHGAGWLLAGDGGAPLGGFDATIVTTPTHHAGPMLRAVDPKLDESLRAIEYAGCSVVCLGVRKCDVAAETPGFGFVVPSIEGRRIIAASFASHKFPGRAPGDALLIRVFVGGALQPGLAELPDDQLLQLVREELRELLGWRGEPLTEEIARWPRGMPQYHVGHLDRVAQIETLTADYAGLELAGAAYRGVGIPQCIHSGQQAADRVAAHLRRG